MRYRIEYAGNRKCTVVNGRAALLKELKTAVGVSDIRVVYRSGVSDSIAERYRRYIKGGGENVSDGSNRYFSERRDVSSLL